VYIEWLKTSPQEGKVVPPTLFPSSLKATFVLKVFSLGKIIANYGLKYSITAVAITLLVKYKCVYNSARALGVI
jgi:hypothetical protein